MSKYIAYTDGGCQNTSVYGEGGSAYLIIHKGEVVKTASKGFLYTTSNRMEMLAIISAVCSVPEGSDLIVYSDSKYAINVFSGIWKPKKNRDLIIKYNERVKTLSSVYFRWIKGHNGDKYNELVDSMCTNSINEIVQLHNLPNDRFKKVKVQLSLSLINNRLYQHFKDRIMKEQNPKRIPQEWWDDYFKRRRRNRTHGIICILLPNLIWILYMLLIKFGYITTS